LVENAITIIETKDSLSKVKNLESYGETVEERLFNVALELSLAWINRILFLKLLEAQLVGYHKGNRDYRFLDIDTIQGFDELFTLFHQVLAKIPENRPDSIKEKYKHVPYLNSSLFEINELEDQTITIESLKDTIALPLINTTILKDIRNQQGELPTLEYIFKFLDAYDFASEGTEGIKENNSSLINASVLGKVFEKINNYEAGSIYTPGFITMYMCRQTIRLAVLQKFKEKYCWNISEFSEIKNYLADRRSKQDILEFNSLINSLRLCDPAVGSGHFLVSSLNEIIVVKWELGIFADEKGERFRDIEITVENDELTVFDTDKSEFFKYQIQNGKPQNKEAHRLQKTLFHEKQTIIENCLFGVDIIPHSAKICRLRLWIELLKNAYYKESSKFTELETLPNIDINIKEGNSLISHFSLHEDLSKVLKQIKYSIEDYRNFVLQYKETRDREAKREFETKIRLIKNDFKTHLFFFSPERRALADLENQLRASESKQFLFGEAETERAERLDKEEKLKSKIQKQKDKIKQIEDNVIYRNSFEWRFEFPEVLDNEGNFIGFDIVIGNPPYIGIEDIAWDYRRFYEGVYKTATGRFDLYSLFIEKAMQIMVKQRAAFAYIVPGKFLNNKQFVFARKLISENHDVTVVKIDDRVFDNAQVNSAIVESYSPIDSSVLTYESFNLNENSLSKISRMSIENILKDKGIVFRLEINNESDELISKIEKDTFKVKEIGEVKDGIVAGTIKDILFLDNKFDEDSKKLYFGKHLSRYHLLETDIWVNYKPHEMLKEEIKRKGEKRPGLWMRNKEIFEREKILTRFVAREIIATYDNENRYYEHTLHGTHIIDNRFKTKYILSLFNSTLFKFYYQKTNSQGGDIFPQVRISSVENLPVKLTSLENQQKFISLVDRILKLKNKGKKTQALEEEIDRLVYQLYNITSEEQAIIEGKEQVS
jgi:adenine-specific DNA-methyltransferase